MLIITGSGRSGTSVLTRFCHNIGYVTGGSWNHSINAGMEDPRFVDVNNLISQGQVTDDIERYATQLPRMVLKDPRFLQPRVAAFWARHRPDIRVLVCVRRMKHMRQSVAAMQCADPSHLRTVAADPGILIDALVELSRCKIPIRFLTFPEFLSDFDAVREALEWGGLRVNRELGKIAWNGLVDKTKVHQR